MRKYLAALFFALSLVPAFGQPPPVPALPDTERRTSYSISASTCACSVGFAIYGDSTDVDEWVSVWINGVKYLSTDPSHGWALTSATGTLATIPRPITNAVLTFTVAQTGTVQIVGARRPRRANQFSENRGVAARDLNQIITDMVAMERERWDLVQSRILQGLPGETILLLPSATSRASNILGFNGSGNPVAISPNIGLGTVIGPASSVSGHVAVFDGATGQLLKDGGPAVGTVSSITAGKNLNGGVITAIGTIDLQDTPTLGTAGSIIGTISFANLSSGTVKLQPTTGALGTSVITLPASSGTVAVGATAPLALSGVGTLTCATCVTTSGGGAISGTAPVSVSAAGVVSITGAAGQVLAGASPAFTAAPTLGASGTPGSVIFGNATSGLLTLQTVTGALSSAVLSLPAATDTLIGKATTDTLTNKTFDTAGSGNSFSINSLAATANTGTGAVVRATAPTVSGATLTGATSAATINKLVITAPANSATLTISDGKVLTVSNTLTLAGTDNTILTGPTSNATIAALNLEGQTLAGGGNVTAKSQPTGNITMNCGSRPLQNITNGGAFTITAPANDGSCILLVTNNASAGAISFSGFSVGASVGDSLTTTNTNSFSIQIWRINGTSGYRIAAHQ